MSAARRRIGKSLPTDVRNRDSHRRRPTLPRPTDLCSTHIDRHALSAELVVPGSAQVMRDALIFRRQATEPSMLPDQRMHVRNGLAYGNDEASVREQLCQIPDARDVVVALRQVTLAAAQSQDLAQVSAERILEVWPHDSLIEHMNPTWIMQPSEVTLPKRFFERFRTVRRDLDAIRVDALLRTARALTGEAILKPVPQKRDFEERKVPIAMRCYAIRLRQQRQQNGRARARQTGQEHGSVDRNRLQALRDEIGLEVGQDLVQRAEASTQRDQAEVLLPQDHARHRRIIVAVAPSVAVPRNISFQLACSGHGSNSGVPSAPANASSGREARTRPLRLRPR